MGDYADEADEQIELRLDHAAAQHALCYRPNMWTDKNGKIHDPWKMNIGHLRNAIQLCRRKGFAEVADSLCRVLHQRELQADD